MWHRSQRPAIRQETSNFELALVTKTGRRVVVLLNATTRRNAEGAVVGVVGIGQDVTAMRLAEDKARHLGGGTRSASAAVSTSRST